MKISVFGTGYVGLVTGVCFAEMGNTVICADIEAQKIARLKNGVSPIYEPGLEQLLSSNLKAKRVQFTTQFKEAVVASEVLIIAVGTPPGPTGAADLTQVVSVAEEIAKFADSYKIVVVKSTVPIGTARLVRNTIQKEQQKLKREIPIDVVSNPEFLREGSALEDCLKPSRVVIGTETEDAAKIMKKLYEPFLKNGNPLLLMDLASSEMTKYAANTMLAARISLMNEFARICDKVGADVEMVRRGIGSDPRIGTQFIFAGLGYGGSCFPKDIKALIQIGQELDQRLPVLNAIEAGNEIQKKWFFEKILKMLVGKKNPRVAFWGLSFKPGTDDIRDSPAIYLIEELQKLDVEINAFDPVALERVDTHFGKSEKIKYFEDQYQVLKDCDLLVIATEWKMFREPDFDRVKNLLNAPNLCDGRNLYQPSDMKDLGFNYVSIGRPGYLS